MTIKVPLWGDAEMVSVDPTMRPSSERMPFGPSGELLPEGPALPVGYLLAPDIKKLPWTRERGDEWTDAAFRAVVLQWIIELYQTHAWLKTWKVVEKSMWVRLRPADGGCYLVITLTHRDGRAVEIAQPFRLSQRTPAEVRAVLDALTLVFETYIL